MNVIFDMDGLMFDTEKVFIKAWDYAGERIGIGKAGYMVYKTLGMSIVASYEIWNEELVIGIIRKNCVNTQKNF